MSLARITKNQCGATLIEVLVALLVLAIGLLGFAGMQTQSVTTARKAYAHSQATFFAQDMVERIRANLTANTIAQYSMAQIGGVAPAAGTDCSVNACNTAQLAQWDRSQWAAEVFAALPNSRVSITIAPAGNMNVVTISIIYSLNVDLEALQQTNTGTNALSDTTFTYSLVTEI